MGLIDDNGGTKWISISQGKFRQKVPAGTSGAVARLNKNGVEVHERAFKGISGKLESIYIQSSDQYGDSLVVRVSDGEERFAFSMPITSSYFKSFINYLPNINKDAELTIKPGLVKKDDGKSKVFITVYQNGDKVEPYYFVYDNDNKKTVYKHGFPEYKEKKFSRIKWDSYKTKVVMFLVDELEKNDFFGFKSDYTPENTSLDSNTSTQETDDLPF